MTARRSTFLTLAAAFAVGALAPVSLTAFAASPNEAAGADEPLACEGTEPINKTCPVSGQAIDPATAQFTAIYRARHIGFATEAAKTEWESWDAKKKNEFLLKHVRPGAINDMCPIGKEPIDPQIATLDYNGASIGFCCASCASKFSAWETAKKDEFVKSYTDRPIANKACPITGEALDEESPTVVFLGTKVAFCCKGCARKWDLFTHAEKADKLKTLAAAAAH